MQCKYILFGTGDYYNRYRHWFEGRDVVAILDNDEKKQGSTLDGHKIIAPSDISKMKYDAVVILSFYYTEIKKQLVELGVSEDMIFHFYDLRELFKRESVDSDLVNSYVEVEGLNIGNTRSILLLSHDLSEGGPALALYHAATVLKKAGYAAVYASMLDGTLRRRLENDQIPVIVDRRLQVFSMNEIAWTCRYDLIICNTINFNVFLSERDTSIPVIWWLHDSPFFYEGIRAGRLQNMDTSNMKILSVGPIPRDAMLRYRPDAIIDDLIYGVSDEV